MDWLLLAKKKEWLPEGERGSHDVMAFAGL